MTFCDVNILVYAHRSESEKHNDARALVQNLITAPGPWAWSGTVLSGFLRIVTHAKVFKTPTPFAEALRFTDIIQKSENAVELLPGADHWPIFRSLVQQANAKGNLIPDCYLAALAIEQGCTFVTTDRNFSRFGDLKLEFL